MPPLGWHARALCVADATLIFDPSMPKPERALLTSSPRTVPRPPRLAGAARDWPWLKGLKLTTELVRAVPMVWLRFPRLRQAEKLDEIQRWAKRVLRILNVEVHCAGSQAASRAGLIVANHLSWLDILVIQSLMPGVFVAKGEVRRWPLIGAMAQACQTIFVNRSSPRSAIAMVEATVAALAQGYSVVAFPEGTSSRGARVGPLHANIFEAAIRAATHVQPLVLRYVDARTGLACEAVPFVGDMSLTSSLRKVMATGAISAQVHIGPCIASTRHNRKSLARQSHHSMQEQLAGQLSGRDGFQLP